MHRRTRSTSRLIAGAALLIALQPGSSGAEGSGESTTPERNRTVSAWQRVLERHVVDGGVDYRSLAADRRELDAYLGAISKEASENLSSGDGAAFWINAYNAVVLGFVLDEFPGIDSVMSVDGFFNRRRAPVAGLLLTLDEIEERALAGGDARVHFALVCAAQSCPPLRAEPYLAGDLDAQLAEQTRLFLADDWKGARLDQDLGVLWLSTLFKWYGDDFTGTGKLASFVARGPLVDWVEPYLPAATAEAIRKLEPAIRFLDYDWALNDRSRR